MVSIVLCKTESELMSMRIITFNANGIRSAANKGFFEWLKLIFDGWLKSGREYVICGDWNIVRSRNDIKNWTSNQKNTGCLPPERAWLNGLIADAHGDGTPPPPQGWRDSFRVAKPEAIE